MISDVVLVAHMFVAYRSMCFPVPLIWSSGPSHSWGGHLVLCGAFSKVVPSCCPVPRPGWAKSQ